MIAENRVKKNLRSILRKAMPRCLRPDALISLDPDTGFWGMLRRHRVVLILGGIFLLALWLRLWGLGYDLPCIYHPDEPKYIAISQAIFKTGDLNPHFFNYPSLFFYLNALAYVPFYLVGKVAGIFHSVQDLLPPFSQAMGVTKAQMPAVVWLGRLLTLLFGMGTVLLAYLAGKKIANRTNVGILAALMVAISPDHVTHSRLVTPDAFVAFFAFAALLFSIHLFQDGKTWTYVAAGLCVGFTASCKYNGALVVLPLLFAHVLRCGRSAFKQPKLYLALLLSLVGFLATTPYALLDAGKFLNDLAFEASHYTLGHSGMEGNSFLWYLGHMAKTGGGLYLIGLLGVIAGFFRHPRENSFLTIFPLVYFAFISNFAVRNDRTFLPMAAFLFVSAAWLIVDYIQGNHKKGLPDMNASKILGNILIVIGLCFGIAFYQSFTSAQTLAGPNARETARVWIDKNLPPGSRIAIESYSPYIDPERFDVQGFGRMIENGPRWYIERGFQYLVFSEGMYGRYLKDPQRYYREKSLYFRFFSEFQQVRAFNGPGGEIRIYRDAEWRLR